MEKFDEKGSYNVDEANYIKNSGSNFDAAESIFLARQLAYVRGKILEVLQKVHPDIRKERWIKVGELNGAASDGSDMIIAGKFQPDYIKFEIPNRFAQLQVQIRNLEYVINCISSVIGVTVTLPMAFVRVEGA